MTNEEKEKMKQERLAEYERRIFFFEMDAAAARAVGDGQFESDVVKEIEKLKLAREAVEAM